jgi:hypothetical protein
MTVDPANVAMALMIALYITWTKIIPAIAERRERAAALQAGTAIVKPTNGSAGGQSKEWWLLEFRKMFEEYGKQTEEFLGGKMDEQRDELRAIARAQEKTADALRDLPGKMILDGRRRR